MTTPIAPAPPAAGELLARHVATRGLPDRSPDAVRVPGSLPAEPLSDLEWRRLIDKARHERMLGLLVATINDAALAVTDEQASEAHEAHVMALAGDLVRERELIGLVELLQRSGIDHRVLKGSAVAHLDYPDPSLRSFADVDLLVRSEEWDDAIDALRTEGWEREFGEPRPGFDRRFVKGMVLRRQPEGGVELDLHRTLSLGPFGLTVRLADLWEGYEVLRLGGAELRALRGEERLVHACFHAALGDVPPRLVPLRDIAQMSLGGNVDFDRVMELARSWRAEAVLARAVGLAWEILGLDQAAEAATRTSSLRPRSSELRALDTYLPPQRSYVGLCLATVKVIRRPSDKLRYVAALAFPQPEFVTPRYGGRTARWRDAARVLRARRTPPAGSRAASVRADR
jgi:hypothetical protein